MYCSVCGTKVPDGSYSCTQCGVQLNANTLPQQGQPYPQQMYVPVYVKTPRQRTPGKGFGITSMILGIVASVVAFSTLFTLLPGAFYNYYSSSSAFLSSEQSFSNQLFSIFLYATLAFIFAAVSRKKGYRNGVSMSGLVMSIFSFAVIVIAIVMFPSLVF